MTSLYGIFVTTGVTYREVFIISAFCLVCTFFVTVKSNLIVLTFVWISGYSSVEWVTSSLKSVPYVFSGSSWVLSLYVIFSEPYDITWPVVL